MPSPTNVDPELADKKLRLECLKLARRQDHKGLTPSQAVRVIRNARTFWCFVSDGVVTDQMLHQLERDAEISRPT